MDAALSCVRTSRLVLSKCPPPKQTSNKMEKSGKVALKKILG